MFWFFGGFVVFSAVSIAYAIGKLAQPIGQVPEGKNPGIELLMSGPIAAYTFPPLEPREMSSDEQMTGQPDVDMRIALARQETKVEGLTQTVEREFARMATALGKHADAVNTAFAAMKNDFVSKSDHAALEARFSRVERMLFAAVGLVMTAFICGLIALVFIKP